MVNDSWDTPDTPRKGATMADIMKRGIVKKREPVTKWKTTVKRKHKTAGTTGTTTSASVVAAAYPAMPPPPPKKLCSGLSLLDRYKKDTNWKDAPEAVVKDEPNDYPAADDVELLSASIKAEIKSEIKAEPLDDGYDEDDDYDMDADFESLMKNEPDFDDDFDDYDDDDNDMDWDKVMRGSGTNTLNTSTTSSRGHSKSSGASSSCSSSSTGTGGGGRKKKKKKKTAKSSKHQQQQPGSGKKIKYDGSGGSGGGGYGSYKTKLMDPVKRALHNDLEKSRRVETSMLFMNLSMQVSFLDDNRKIPSKLSILRGAKRECDLMMLDERRLLSEKHVMQQKQRMLRERLFELRREQYHRRYGKNKQ